MSSAAIPSALRRAVLVTALATAALSARPSIDGSTPPAYPDTDHVLNGCYISTTAYLARFRAVFPAERATALAITPRGFPGKHTIAVVTWGGRWWGRDEYFGVFALESAVEHIPEPNGLAVRATRIFSRHASVEVRAGRATSAPAPGDPLPATDRARHVSLAARLLPCPGEIFWVLNDTGSLPFLFFRPAPGQVAIYDPASGTCRAACDEADSAQLVREAAIQLGYGVREVRGGVLAPGGATLAAADSDAGALPR